MPWTFRPNYIADGSGIIEMFGQMVFTGAYKTNGDTGVFDFVNKPTAGFSSYRKGRQIDSSRPPVFADVVVQGLFLPILIPGVSATDFRVLIFDLTALTELANIAYPAQIANNPFHTLSIAFPRV